MFERFGFSNTFKWITSDLLDKAIDSLKDFFVNFLSVQVILPGIVRKNELHSISSLSGPCPFSSCAMDSISRLVFLGERKR